MIRYAKPKTVEEALRLLKEDRWRILAGGTDFYPAQGVRPIREDVLDINGLADLRGIAETDHFWIFGARTSWTDVVRATLPPAFDALRQAAREVGSVQIQNAGTIAGNLCNASPAADGVPPLLALDAEVELRSAGGVRIVPLFGFILGNRKTALRDDELLAAIRVPKSSAAGRSAFVKLGARRYLVISIAMAAARIRLDDDGRIAYAAVAVGSCSAVARRLRGVEAAVVGAASGDELADAVRTAPLPEIAPIDDVRGSADYRREAAREIVLRAVAAAAEPERTKARAA
ncbi:xanthine dehydrogenase family protein subunit M [Mesorhizobium sp. LHD-90]|uniref:FAD binding domain-containing protein n=1 Tax=Mesorhizobium sp. LHD-90 TaxID=3071414 RepID=UPI0027E1737E|nr:xanthine dehydrogenase family protein subunit M [Mesorhizobium sp. LHD-90]MDQ6435873.1 xanthine dehydrogenase family protein subunit M [Mesorhizobium sp. LHD-90]